MTDAYCETYCNSDATGAPYKYFGITYGRDCYCGNTPNYVATGDSTQCTWPNSGNSSESGGSDTYENMWLNKRWKDPNALPPTPVPKDTNFDPNAYLGCYPSKNNAQEDLLQGPSQIDEGVTHAKCLAFCNAQPQGPYKFLSIEGGNRCHCSNSYEYGIAQSDISTCQTGAAGNTTEAGGGDGTQSVWQNAGYQNVRPLFITLCSKTVLCKQAFDFDPG